MFSEPKPTTVTREELYAQVWSTPAMHLAKQYGVSDVAIAKACRKLNVPKPPPGYWAEIAAGKPAPKPELPLRPPGGRRTATFYPVGCVRSRYPQLEDFEIPQSLQRCHPLVGKTLWADHGEVDFHGCVVIKRRGTLNVVTSPRLFKRALRFMEGLIRSALRREWKVDAQGRRSRTYLTVNGLVFEMALSEPIEQRDVRDKRRRYNHWSDPEYISVLTGKLKLNAEIERTASAEWSDEDGRSLEEQLPEIFARLVEITERVHRDRIARAEAEKIAAEERKRAEEEKWRREEPERKKALERERRDKLLSDAASWTRWKEIKALCDEVARRSETDPATFPPKETARWLQWARSIAARYDPFHNGSVSQALKNEGLQESIDCRPAHEELAAASWPIVDEAVRKYILRR